MTPTDFRELLHGLQHGARPEQHRAAEGALARQNHDEQVVWVLTFWPPERLHWRQRVSRHSEALRLLVPTLMLLGLSLPTFLIPLQISRPSILGIYATGSVVVAVVLYLTLMIRRAPSVVPLLVRLDDTRLVPYWLEELGALHQGPERIALLERLTRHLPYWHTTGEPLPDFARKALQVQIDRLANEQWSVDEAAFLTAVLVSLDNDADRGIAVDDATRRRLPTLLHDHRNEPVRVAAEDALQRLGLPPH